MILRSLIKIKVVLKQNFYAFLIVIFWFIFNFIYFYMITKSIIESVYIIIFFKVHNSYYGSFYDAFTEFIIFGLVFGLITVELFRKYNPLITSREISKKTSDHIVIIGYTNIGKRIAEYLRNKKIRYVIVEEDYDLIEDLIIKEEAVVNDSPLSLETLEDAGVKDAKAVFITSGDFEIQLVTNYNVRLLNPTCKLVSRIFEDDIANVIEKTYNTEIISTSQYAASVIFDKISSEGYNNILIIGLNHISIRLIKDFNSIPNIRYQLIEENDTIIQDYIVEKLNIICGDPKEKSTLEKVNINDIDCIINTLSDVKNSFLITKKIRDLNKNCKIISRFFLESVAEVLEKPPFQSEVISSSKGTLEIMIKRGMFNF